MKKIKFLKIEKKNNASEFGLINIDIFLKII